MAAMATMARRPLLILGGRCRRLSAHVSSTFRYCSIVFRWFMVYGVIQNATVMVCGQWTLSTASRNQSCDSNSHDQCPASAPVFENRNPAGPKKLHYKSLLRTEQKQDLLSHGSSSSTCDIICEVLPFRPRISANSFFSFSLHRHQSNRLDSVQAMTVS